MRYKEIKNFGGREITIRLLSRNDLRHPEKFQEFINSLVREDVPINTNREVTLKEEIKWLKRKLEKIRKKKEISLIAQDHDLIVGNADVKLCEGRSAHIADFGIAVKREYRRKGIGEYLAKKIIMLAKKDLKPTPKIIQLRALAINKPALNLYRKLGFKKVAKIPHQFQYKGKLVDEIVMLLYLDKNLSKKK